MALTSPEDLGSTYIETQFETETMKAVPTPRLDVGEKTFAAQLLHSMIIHVDKREENQ